MYKRQRCLEAIARLEPAVRAFVSLDAETARREADAASARWRAGTPRSLVDGLPIGIKDCFDVRGFPTRANCAYFDAAPNAANDAAPVSYTHLPKLTARFVAEIRQIAGGHVPEDVRETALCCILDWLGTAYAGSCAPASAPDGYLSEEDVYKRQAGRRPAAARTAVAERSFLL